MLQSKGYAQLKKGRHSEQGYVYHLVFSTKKRKPIFNGFYLARKLISILKQDQEYGFTKTLSFVVMPDHIHWLIELKKGDVSQAVQRIKSLFTKVSGINIWNVGFYDHGIRDDENLINVARYIVANPLRAGLVGSVRDYPHWDSIWLE